MGRPAAVNWFHRSRVLRPILLGLVAAVVAAALAPLFTPARGPVVVLPGLIAGAVFALTDFAAIRSREDSRARAREALGFDLTPALRKLALNRPVAADPVARKQQRQIVDHLSGQVESGLRRSILVFAATIAFQVALAFVVTPVFWIAAAATMLGLASILWETRRLRRRRALLGSAPRGDAAGNEPQPLPRA